MKDCRRTLLDEFVKLSKDWDNNNMLYNSLMFSKLYPGDVENSVADASLMPKQSDEKMRNDIMTSWWTPTKIFLLGNKKELMQKSRKELEEFFMNNKESLAHTSWNCKFHIVFAPKYRRREIYEALRRDIGRILRMLCERKEIEIIEAECCPDHIHMLVRIPPKYSVSEIVGYLKGKSSLMIFEKHANLKYKYGNRHFWCRGYYVDTVGKNTAAIKEYIQNQLKEDLEYDQMSLVEYIDPFTGEPVKKNKK